MAAAAMASELEQGTELEEEPGHATAVPDFEQLGRGGPAGGGADPAAEIRPRAWRWEPAAMLLRRAPAAVLLRRCAPAALPRA